jgi:hypothetical protein
LLDPVGQARPRVHAGPPTPRRAARARSARRANGALANAGQRGQNPGPWDSRSPAAVTVARSATK